MRSIAALAILLALPAMALDEIRPDLWPLSSDLRIRVLRGRDLSLEVRARADDSWAGIARRVAAAEDRAAAIAASNPGGKAAEGDWVRVPLALLSTEYRSLVLTSLFPEDRRKDGDWVHVARKGRLATYDAGMWQIAEWFTGRGDTFGKLMAANDLDSPEVVLGQEIRIPAELLHPGLRASRGSADGRLLFGSDERGPYAIYRLKQGEALYSAVVIRFTGRTKAADVVAVAKQIQERSAISDLHDIPVGFPVKIPFDVLEPEFLPDDDPRRVEADAARREIEAELARAPVRPARSGLEGVVIILDPGHGGRDLGTMNNGIWEHDYVYDVACRLKQRLDERTAAKVYLTLLDEQTGCAPSQTDKLVANREGTIQTQPPFLARDNGEATIGVNLRWYLANSLFRKERAAGTDPDRVVFLSLHADSRHPSLSGVMVYVPGANHAGKTHGFSSKTYTRFAEVREEQYVTLSSKERIRSEAVSQKLAEEIVRAFQDGKLPIQPYQPVRNRIIRGRSTFVPAVLRGNTVPTKVLVEMVNLSNASDASLLANARERERLAEALFQSLLTHYKVRD
jgi:N-acetylmuramoyl-L-alanine amidase